MKRKTHEPRRTPITFWVTKTQAKKLEEVAARFGYDKLPRFMEEVCDMIIRLLHKKRRKKCSK